VLKDRLAVFKGQDCSTSNMHGHTIELVTNLLLPGMYDVRSVAKSKSGDSPLNSIDIIDGDDYDRHECVDRLRGAMHEPALKQLVLSEMEMDGNVIDALMDLLRSGRQWQALYLQFCEGDLDKAIEAILTLDNVTKLEIAGNVDAVCINSLSLGLAGNDTLKELALLVTLDRENVHTLIDGLTVNTGLRRFKLIKSSFFPDSIEPLADFLRNDEKFETLHFDRCNHVADNNIATLVNSLENHPALTELYIGGNLCEESIRSALSNLIIRNTLRHLSLHSRQQVSRDT
jgi:hypothetical protein